MELEINPKHHKKLFSILQKLDNCNTLLELKLMLPNMYKTEGSLDNKYSVPIDDDYEVTFEFRDGNVYNVDYIKKL
jgi:plasmid maintenance system killer protein